MSQRVFFSGVPRPRVLQVDWLANDEGPLFNTPGRVALSSCPGRTDVGGDVKSDVEHLVSLGISVVVSLVSDAEMEHYRVFGLRRAFHAAKLHSVQFPLEDTQPPRSIAKTQWLCRNLLGWLGEGAHVLIHCIGGWGRSGTVAASLLTHEGFSAEAAIALVREHRSPRCVESSAQEDFLHRYAQMQSSYARYYFVTDRHALKSSGLVGGAKAERVLLRMKVDPEALCDAQSLAQAIESQKHRGLGELIILSGEIEKSAAKALQRPFDTAGYALDRAFGHDGHRWQALCIADLLR